MITLKEYNNKHRTNKQYEISWLGVACDNCGSELYNPTPGISLTTDPPKINVRCSKCDFSGYMTL